MPTSRDEISSRIRKILTQEFSLEADAGTFGEATGLLGRGIGLDSVEILTLVSAIEDSFNLTIEDDELEAEQFATIGTLVSFVERRLV